VTCRPEIGGGFADGATRGAGILVGGGSGAAVGSIGAVANKLLPNEGPLSNAVNKSIVTQAKQEQDQQSTPQEHDEHLISQKLQKNLPEGTNPEDDQWQKYDNPPQTTDLGKLKTIEVMRNSPNWKQMDETGLNWRKKER